MYIKLKDKKIIENKTFEVLKNLSKKSYKTFCSKKKYFEVLKKNGIEVF